MYTDWEKVVVARMHGYSEAAECIEETLKLLHRHDDSEYYDNLQRSLHRHRRNLRKLFTRYPRLAISEGIEQP
jgi:hypothetical protein